VSWSFGFFNQRRSTNFGAVGELVREVIYVRLDMSYQIWGGCPAFIALFYETVIYFLDRCHQRLLTPASNFLAVANNIFLAPMLF
jgi:hypothetical protein